MVDEPKAYEVHALGTKDLLVEVLVHLRHYSGNMRPEDAQSNFALADKVERHLGPRTKEPVTLSVNNDGISLGWRR